MNKIIKSILYLFSGTIIIACWSVVWATISLEYGRLGFGGFILLVMLTWIFILNLDENKPPKESKNKD